MAEQIDVLIGGNVGDHVRVTLLGPPYEEGGGFGAKIEVQAGPFFGSFTSYLYVRELIAFCREIEQLYDTLSGMASIRALEGCLTLQLTGNSLGHVQVTGHVTAEPARKASLHFDFDIDQTFLPAIRNALVKLKSDPW